MKRWRIHPRSSGHAHTLRIQNSGDHQVNMASPRPRLNLAAQTFALLHGRAHAAGTSGHHGVLRHRVILTYGSGRGQHDHARL